MHFKQLNDGKKYFQPISLFISSEYEYLQSDFQ